MTTNMMYPIAMEVGTDGEMIAAFVPDIEGCVAVGSSYDEVMANVKKAIELCLSHRQGLRLPFPMPGSVDEHADAMEGPKDFWMWSWAEVDVSAFMGRAR